MTTRARQGRTRADEQGAVAIITVLLVCATLSAFLTIMFQLTLSNQNAATSHLDLQESFSTAEGGLDMAESVINNSTQSNLPCGPTAETGTVSSTPQSSTYSESVTYYDTFPPSDAALSCSAVTGGTATPLAAEIVSTGASGRSDSYMEALLKITVTTQDVFADAMFSQAGMTWSNNAVIYGHTGNDANIYSNSNITCANNSDVSGSVSAQGSWTGQNNCVVAGNVEAVGNLLAENNTDIQGSAYSTGTSGCGGSSTQGNITLENNATVVQSAYAYCTISTSNNATVGGTKAQYDTGIASPAVQTFPTVSFNATSFTSAGYSNQVTNNSCSGSSSVYTTIANMSSAQAPTVVQTSCALDWANNTSITTAKNLVVFSTAGFTFQNNTEFSSANSSTQDLYFVVPTGTSCAGNNGDINLENNTSFSSNVNVMFFTPCTLDIQNNSTGYGQVYAGTIEVQNNFSAHYVPMPAIPGATGGAASASGSSVTIGVTYIRQIESPAFA